LANGHNLQRTFLKIEIRAQEAETAVGTSSGDDTSKWGEDFSNPSFLSNSSWHLLCNSIQQLFVTTKCPTSLNVPTSRVFSECASTFASKEQTHGVQMSITSDCIECFQRSWAH